MLRGILGGFARGRRQTSGPTLSLNFLAGLDDSRITYSGGANGTRVNSAGVIVAATTPRFDYNPVTLAARGLLIEEARTNLLLRSSNVGNASWTKVGCTVTANATTAPDGTLTAEKIVEDTSTGLHIWLQVVTGVANTSYVLTPYFKAAERTLVQIQIDNNAANGCSVSFNVSTGVVTVGPTNGGTASGAVATVESAGNGWFRCRISGIPFTAGTTLRALLYLQNGAGSVSYTGDGTSGVFVWGHDLQAGAFPTSYIPTTTAAVTRTADSAVMTGTNFSSWYNQSEGTFVFGADTFSTAAEIPIFTVQDSPLNDSFHRASILFASQRLRYVASNGPTQADIQPVTTITAGAQFKGAFAYATNDFAACLNAGTVATDASGSVPTDIAQMVIGGGGYLTSLNGHIQTIQYFPRRSANEQLQAMTA